MSVTDTVVLTGLTHRIFTIARNYPAVISPNRLCWPKQCVCVCVCHGMNTPGRHLDVVSAGEVSEDFCRDSDGPRCRPLIIGDTWVIRLTLWHISNWESLRNPKVFLRLFSISLAQPQPVNYYSCCAVLYVVVWEAVFPGNSIWVPLISLFSRYVRHT